MVEGIQSRKLGNDDDFFQIIPRSSSCLWIPSEEADTAISKTRRPKHNLEEIMLHLTTLQLKIGENVECSRFKLFTNFIR